MVHYSASLDHAWPKVGALRAAVGDVMANHASELREAVMMAASELVENAIKYGEKVTSAPTIFFSLAADDEAVLIETRNGCTDRARVRDLAARVDELGRAEDKGALYHARVEELLVNPAQSASLGLYRIAFEGRFELECRYENDVVTVAARRKA